jgi:hypothetical protein
MVLVDAAADVGRVWAWAFTANATTNNAPPTIN